MSARLLWLQSQKLYQCVTTPSTLIHRSIWQTFGFAKSSRLFILFWSMSCTMASVLIYHIDRRETWGKSYRDLWSMCYKFFQEHLAMESGHDELEDALVAINPACSAEGRGFEPHFYCLAGEVCLYLYDCSAHSTSVLSHTSTPKLHRHTKSYSS